ncbi:MAG: hypothetical protein QXJ06_06020 [Candidatus Aenigmatarchaeota archaeon]
MSSKKLMKKTKINKFFLISGIVLTVLIVFLVLGKSIKVPYQAKIIEVVKEPYTEKVCKDVQVPYTEKVCHTEKEPYTENYCENKNLIYKSTVDNIYKSTTCTRNHQECQKYFLGICTEWRTVCDEYTTICSFSITNLDTEVGTWIYSWEKQCITPGCRTISEANIGTYSLTIDPTETKDTWAQLIYAPTDEQTCIAKIISIPKKQVCQIVTKYRDKQVCQDVIRYRTETQCEDVTKYKDVEKEKEVTKYHSLFEEWGITTMVTKILK